jgi:hypothetical protein
VSHAAEPSQRPAAASTPRQATTASSTSPSSQDGPPAPPREASPTFAERLAARSGGAVFLADLRALRQRAGEVGIRGAGVDGHPAEMLLDVFVLVAVRALTALLTIIDAFGTPDVVSAIGALNRSLGGLMPAALDTTAARIRAGLPAVAPASTTLSAACGNMGSALVTARRELDDLIATAVDACRPEEAQQLGGHLETVRAEAILVLQSIRTAEREMETIQAFTVGVDR